MRGRLVFRLVLRGSTTFVLLAGATVMSPNAPVFAADDVALHEPAASHGSPANPPKASAGMRVYIDPDTGKIGAPPPAIAPAMNEHQGALTTGSDLVEEVATTPAGGARLDLRGRFRATSTVQVGPDGRVTTDCTTSAHPSGKE